jgi:hypothetical protein
MLAACLMHLITRRVVFTWPWLKVLDHNFDRCKGLATQAGAKAEAAAITQVFTPAVEAVLEPMVAASAGPVVDPAVEEMAAEAVAPRKVGRCRLTL